MEGWRAGSHELIEPRKGSGGTLAALTHRNFFVGFPR